MIKIYFCLVLLLHLILLIVLRFTAWPEMFSYPYLLNNGFHLYKDIALPYEPLLPEVLRLIYTLFGYRLEVLQSLTWVTILMSDLLLFLISIRLLGKKLISLLPVILYVLIQPFADGNMLWFDLFTVPFILLGLTLYFYLEGSKKYFWLGFFLGLAFFIKQQFGISVVLLLFYLLFRGGYREKIPPFLAGFVTPLIAVVMYVLLNGITRDYIFWTIIVPVNWYPQFPGYVHLPSINQALLTILLFVPGVLAYLKNLKIEQEDYTLVGLIFAGTFLTAFPRFELFRLQPATAMYIVLIILLMKSISRLYMFFIISFVVLAGILLIKPTLFAPRDVRFYQTEDLMLAETIKNYSRANNVYLLGISSLQYVLTNKIPPKPWVDNYVWYLEIPGIQDLVISGFKNTPPDIVFRKVPELGNWYDLGVYQPKQIVEYINLNYDKGEVLPGGIEVWTKR